LCDSKDLIESIDPGHRIDRSRVISLRLSGPDFKLAGPRPIPCIRRDERIIVASIVLVVLERLELRRHELFPFTNAVFKNVKIPVHLTSYCALHRRYVSPVPINPVQERIADIRELLTPGIKPIVKVCEDQWQRIGYCYARFAFSVIQAVNRCRTRYESYRCIAHNPARSKHTIRFSEAAVFERPVPNSFDKKALPDLD